MQLKSFKATNFRSINDSGRVQVSKLTSLVGRNESGKSNLLMALCSLNPPGGLRPLDPVKDFPRHRRLEECNESTEVIESEWELTESERVELLQILPRATDVRTVRIGRHYGAQRWVGFPNLGTLDNEAAKVTPLLRKVVAATKAMANKAEAEQKDALITVAEAVSTYESRAITTATAPELISVIDLLRQSLAEANVELSAAQDRVLDELQDLANSIARDAESQLAARNWAAAKMPIFVYLDEYPELHGHQSITEYLQRKEPPNRQQLSDINFEKLCKVAGLEPKKLIDLWKAKEPETRNQLVNRAGAVITAEIRRLWKDRQLKIRFNVDAEYLDTFVSDPNAVYDVEVNLDERSRGFKWFLSFYVTFAADTKGGDAENAILLLDEPGLYLHARSQGDLLAHLSVDFKNQIIYTTHSPFMIPTQNLDTIRTVSIAEDTGTKVSNEPAGDANTLFPLQAALGYDLTQGLFVGPNNLVVEGVTDYWILSAVSEYLGAQGRDHLNRDLTITPAGGAPKISYMVALLTSERLNVLVLFDAESQAKNRQAHLLKEKLISNQNIILVTEAFQGVVPTEADLEDLLDSHVYEALVRESYAKELKGRKLSLNAKIPRIARRVEAAFEDLGIPFHKTRPARLFLSKMAFDPESVVTEETAERFERLFSIINGRLDTQVARAERPFGA